FQYVLGKPLPATDPDRLDVDEWQKLQEQARPPREMSEVMNGVPAQVASDVTRIAWPCKVEKNFAEPLRAGIKVLDELDAERAKHKQPSANGGNGHLHVPEPTANGSNGTLPDWWDEGMREVGAESRRGERDGRGKTERQEATEAGRAAIANGDKRQIRDGSPAFRYTVPASARADDGSKRPTKASTKAGSNWVPAPARRRSIASVAGEGSR